MRRRVRSTIARVGALLVVLSAGAAWADEGSGSNPEGETSRVSFHPSIQVSGIADDNVELRGNDGKGDLGVFVAPRVELGYQGSWFDLAADVGVDVREYARHDSPSDVFYRMIGSAELGLMPGLTVGVWDAWVPTPVDLGLPEDHAENLVQTNRVAASVSYWRELPEGREMRVSAQGTRLMSEGFRTQIANGVYDGNFRADFWEGAVAGEIQSPLLERTSGFLRTEGRIRRFDDSSASDFADVGVLLGIRTHWHRSVDFDVAAGYGLVDFGSDLDHRILAEVNLRYRIPGGTTLRLSAVNRNTADIVGNAFMETRGELGVERRFGERTAASATVFLSRFDSDWDSGSNVYGGLEAEVRRQLTRRTQLALQYRYWQNTGSYGIDDFTQNLLRLVVRYRR